MADPLTRSDRPRVFLLDGMALAYRAHFAFLRNPLQTSRGQPTSAVFGFLAALDRIVDQEQPEEIGVVFDGREPTFRHKAFPEYKATRDKMPEEMVPQLAWIRRAVEGEGIPFLLVEGYEADDVIGTLARAEAAAGKDVWIVSGDKDMLQLVDDHVRLYNVMKPGQAEVEIVGPAEVEPRFGVPANQVVDMLGLMGDASDNVPGVRGVGEKTASRLVHEHGSLEAVLQAAADGKIPQKKLAENLRTSADLARLSKRLVTIDVEVPMKIPPLARRARDTTALRDLYGELEFRGRLDGLGVAEPAAEGDVRYRTADTAEKVRRLAADLLATKGKEGFALDTETTGTDPLRADLVGLSFAWREREAWYVPVNLDPPMFGGPAERVGSQTSLFDSGTRSGDTRAVLDALRKPLEDAGIPKTGQNAKYDLHVLARHGVEVRGVAFDTMVADWCADPGLRQHNLDDMALRRLGVRKIPTESLIGTGRSQITMREVPVADVARYACEDADVTWRLRHVLEPELAERGVDRVFRDVEMPLLPVLVRMEANGIRVDVKRLERLGADLEARAAEAEAGILRHCPEGTNVRSNAALGAVLFDQLELHRKAGRSKPRRTAKGTGYATDEETLLELAPYHELPGLILTYRTLTKLKSTYVDALPQYVNPETGRVHTTFHQTGAATGRLASSDPNLQNIPVRSEEGRAIRRAFVPEEGWRFLSADYSQIELRLLAQLSGDPGLIEAFQSGEDIHRATAARVFRVAPKDVTPDLRGRAKAVNFGVIYGMGPQRLARETKVTLDEARKFISDYFDTYPRVREWLDQTVENARKTGYVVTLLGRRRDLPELASPDPMVQANARNVAMNTPLQGTAADLIKIAMIRIDGRLRKERWRSRMLVQIHDELLFETPPDEAERLADMVRAEMTGAMALDVPIVVDVGFGDTWADAH
jgi:DNA polymerase-1